MTYLYIAHVLIVLVAKYRPIIIQSAVCLTARLFLCNIMTGGQPAYVTQSCDFTFFLFCYCQLSLSGQRTLSSYSLALLACFYSCTCSSISVSCVRHLSIR